MSASMMERVAEAARALAKNMQAEEGRSFRGFRQNTEQLTDRLISAMFPAYAAASLSRESALLEASELLIECLDRVLPQGRDPEAVAGSLFAALPEVQVLFFEPELLLTVVTPPLFSATAWMPCALAKSIRYRSFPAKNPVVLSIAISSFKYCSSFSIVCSFICKIPDIRMPRISGFQTQLPIADLNSLHAVLYTSMKLPTS